MSNALPEGVFYLAGCGCRSDGHCPHCTRMRRVPPRPAQTRDRYIPERLIATDEDWYAMEAQRRECNRRQLVRRMVASVWRTFRYGSGDDAP